MRRWTKKIKFYDILLAEYFKSKWILLFRFIYFGKNRAEKNEMRNEKNCLSVIEVRGC